MKAKQAEADFAALIVNLDTTATWGEGLDIPHLAIEEAGESTQAAPLQALDMVRRNPQVVAGATDKTGKPMSPSNPKRAGRRPRPTPEQAEVQRKLIAAVLVKEDERLNTARYIKQLEDEARAAWLAVVESALDAGVSQRALARELGINEKSMRKRISRCGPA